MTKDAANWGRASTASDFRRGLMPASRSLYIHRFGSLKKANKLAFEKKGL